jgi:hypothetical protein
VIFGQVTPTSGLTGNGFWDNPDGNPTPTDTEYASPWKRTPAPVYDEDAEEDWSEGDVHIMATDSASSPSQTSGPSHVSNDETTLHYLETIYYPVRKTGYYCVAIVPLTVMDMGQRSIVRTETDVPNHPSYTGIVLFRNAFNGYLSAAEYPKVNVGSVSILLSIYLSIPSFILH